MCNIGCVIYTETDMGIKGEWVFYRDNKVEHGHGIGTRLTPLKSKRKFEGNFEITYFDSEDNKLVKLDLIISFESEWYTLIWKKNEEITDVGIGVERDCKLIVNYSEVI